MIPLHEETNPDGTPKCVQWLIGDKHYTGRIMCFETGEHFESLLRTVLIKVSYTGELLLVDCNLLKHYQRPENIKKPS